MLIAELSCMSMFVAVFSTRAKIHSQLGSPFMGHLRGEMQHVYVYVSAKG